MSGLGGDKTSYRKTPHHHDDPLVLLERIRAKPDSRTETDSGYSDSVVEGVNSTQPISWGRLLRLDVSKGSGIDLADRHGNFPASRPQGYIFGRDYECGESNRGPALWLADETTLVDGFSKTWSSIIHLYPIVTA